MRHRRIQQRQALQLIGNLMIGGAAVLACGSTGELSGVFALLSALQLIVNLWFMRKSGIPWFSFGMLFCLMTYVFHFGNVLLIAIGQSQYCSWDIVNASYSITDFNLSCAYSVFCSGMTATGIVLAYGAQHGDTMLSEYRNSSKTNRYGLMKLRRLGILLLAISIVPTLYMQWLRIQVILGGGLYSQTRSVDGQLGVFYYLTRFFPFALMMIMIGYKDRKHIARLVFLLGVAYEVICMTSGNRSLQVIAIVTYAFVYLNVVRKKRLKRMQIALLAVFGYVGIAAINMIMRIRNFGVLSYDLKAVFADSILNSPLLAVIGEFGITQLSVSLAFTNIPQFASYKLGESYIFALLAAIPNLGGVLTELNNKAVYVYDFIFGRTYTLGGSYIGELYANFGWFGIIGALGVGYFVGKICRGIFAAIAKQRWERLAMLLVLFYFNLFWVRNYFYGFMFTFVWTAAYIKLFGGMVMKFRTGGRSV